MNSVIKGSSYILAHAPDMVIHNGSTQTTERIVNPKFRIPGEAARIISAAMSRRALKYAPNQTYIGNMTPGELGAIAQPWYDKPLAEGPRYGKFGEIMPEDEFYMLMQVCDVFDLLHLEKGFVEDVKPRFVANPVIRKQSVPDRLKTGNSLAEIRAAGRGRGALRACIIWASWWAA